MRLTLRIRRAGPVQDGLTPIRGVLHTVDDPELEEPSTQPLPSAGTTIALPKDALPQVSILTGLDLQRWDLESNELVVFPDHATFSPQDRARWQDLRRTIYTHDDGQHAAHLRNLVGEMYRWHPPDASQVRNAGNQGFRDDLRTAVGAHWKDRSESNFDIDLPPVAAISGLLFEGLANKDRLQNLGQTLPGAEHVALQLDLEDTPTQPMLLDVTQTAQGFRFRALTSAGQPLEVNESDEPTLRLRRWNTSSPSAMPDVERVLALPSGPLEMVDVLAEDELLGRLLTWRMELRNAHGRVLYRADVVRRRERLDPPAAVPGASATLDPTTGQVELDVELPKLDGEVRADLQLYVYSRSRPLMRLGYYGGADDLAYLEGLRLLDLSGGEAPIVKPEAAAEASLVQATYAGAGLTVVARLDLHNAGERLRTTLKLDALLGHPSDGAPRGVRLRVAIVRRREDPREPLPTSTLVDAHHQLRLPDAQTTIMPVFQLERVRLEDPAPRFVPSASVDPQPLEHDTEPTRVRLVWRHLPDRHDEPVGGYRLWMRDLVEGDSDAPFEPVADLESLPPLIAALRPLPALGGGSHERARWPDTPQVTPTSNARQALGKALQELRDSQDLMPGSPHLQPANMDSEGAGGLVALKVLATPADEPAALALQALGALHAAHLAVPVSLSLASVESLLELDSLATPPAMFTAEPWTRLPQHGVRLVLCTDAQGTPHSSVVLMAVPTRQGWKSLFETAGVAVPEDLPERLVRALGTQALVLLKQRPLDRAAIAWDRFSRLSWTWSGLSDRWRHQQEWVVEARDRYAHLRDLLRDPTVSWRRPVNPPPEVIRDLAIRRREPIDERISIVGQKAPGEAWFAFRLAVPTEVRQAAHNTLNRTRLGIHELDWQPLRRITQTELLLAHHPEQLPEVDAALYKDAVDGWDPEILDGAEEGPEANPWSTFQQPMTDARPPRSGGLVYSTDTVELYDEAYFFDIRMSVRLTADGIAGPWSHASQRRPPRLLGLYRRPRCHSDQSSSLEKAKGEYALQIDIVLASLASHLDPKELAECTRSDRPTQTFGAYCSSAPSSLCKTPLHLLPDLKLQYAFFLDVQPGTLPRAPTVPVRPSLVPLATWTGPGSSRSLIQAGPRNQWGFAPTSLQPWLTAVASAEHPLRSELRLETTPTCPEPVQQALDGLERGQPRLYVQLFRGLRATAPFLATRF